MVRRRLIGSAAALCLALPLGAAAMTFHLDPAKTTVQFTFGATLHTVNGTVRAKEGTIRFDPAAGAAEGWVVLDATSAQTGNSRRDRKMHEKTLESRRFPDITFTVARISGTINPGGRSEIQLRGTLEMHGTSRPVDLPATVIVNGEQVTATGFLTVPYLEWGLDDPSFLLLRVAKEVRVEIKAAGRLSQ
ncbi:MAG TPA: YceI family protein [Thermoanaerobaculia bacterium]|nr:YceI family protein [Thermoanaerobaculia bacterium]